MTHTGLDLTKVKERVLLVDDDRAVLALLNRYMTLFGLQADHANDGKEAVEFLRSHQYGLVITDMVMPEMDGMELLLHIVKHYPHVDVLVISAYTKIYSFSDIVAAGANDFLSKPFKQNELKAKLQRIFRERFLLASLVKAKEEAQAASKTKSAFLATMSHELRTPMNAIIGYTEIALNSGLTKEQQEYIQAVQFAGETLLSLIKDILDFSAIEAGKLEIRPVKFKLSDLINKLIIINQGRIREKGLKLHTSAPDLDQPLISDPDRVIQVLSNLIGNAVKFTNEGHVSIDISIKDQSEKQITLKFSVTDTGIGMPENIQREIFDAFSQADDSITRQYGGSGLGLSISNQLIALLGGKSLKVKSSEGKGSSFFFELPFTIEHEPEPVEQVQKSPEKLADSLILLIEDNPVNTKLISRVLERQGHTVKTAENGRLGVEAAFKEDFDIILMDMQMPEMDGLSATREIRRLEKCRGENKNGPIPIIAITANAMKGDREKCIEAGMNDYLTKPIKVQEINQALGRFLGCPETD